jgi:hypothetical protein
MFIPRTVLGTFRDLGPRNLGVPDFSPMLLPQENRRILFYLFFNFKSGIHVAKTWLNYFFDDGHTKLATSQNPSEKHSKVPGS